MSDPSPLLFTAILLSLSPLHSHPSPSLYLHHPLSTMLDHSQQHTPATNKAQNSDEVLLLDPPATPFAAFLPQTTSPTPLTPLSPNGFSSTTKSQGAFHVATPSAILPFLTHSHTSLPNPHPIQNKSPSLFGYLEITPINLLRFTGSKHFSEMCHL